MTVAKRRIACNHSCGLVEAFFSLFWEHHRVIGSTALRLDCLVPDAGALFFSRNGQCACTTPRERRPAGASLEFATSVKTDVCSSDCCCRADGSSGLRRLPIKSPSLIESTDLVTKCLYELSSPESAFARRLARTVNRLGEESSRERARHAGWRRPIGQLQPQWRALPIVRHLIKSRVTRNLWSNLVSKRPTKPCPIPDGIPHPSNV